MKLTPDQIMNAGRAIVGVYPPPPPEVIDATVSTLCKAFDVPFTVESDAKAMWRAQTRGGLT